MTQDSNVPPMPEQAGSPLALGELERGMLVTWLWPASYIEEQSRKGVRPVGKIVTSEDRPGMLVDENGPFLIAVIDNPAWLFSPYQVMAKGNPLWRYDEHSPGIASP